MTTLVYQNGIYQPELELKLPSLRDVLRLFTRPMAMAGFCPDEGEAYIASLIYGAVTTDQGANMQLGLLTNVAPGETITEATITEPTGTGYARITLVNGTWTGAADTRSYPAQVFTGGVGGWTGAIQGYFINTTGTTNRLTAIEVDSAGPYTIGEGDTYTITPNNTFA